MCLAALLYGCFIRSINYDYDVCKNTGNADYLMSFNFGIRIVELSTDRHSFNFKNFFKNETF